MCMHMLMGCCLLLNSLDVYVSMRLSSPMCPFTDEFLQEIVVSFWRNTLAQLSAICIAASFVNNMEEKGHLVLPSLAA